MSAIEAADGGEPHSETGKRPLPARDAHYVFRVSLKELFLIGRQQLPALPAQASPVGRVAVAGEAGRGGHSDES